MARGRTAVPLALCALLALGACGGQPELRNAGDEASGSPGAAGSPDPTVPSTQPSPIVPTPLQPGTDPSAGATVKPEAVRGGGFASTLPGTDAPDRKDDPGPVIALSAEQPDIKEIERLVRAVERIARQQAASEPSAAGGSLAEAVGTFSYRYFADGSVAPDPAWVAANIRIEAVPILGLVNCHRVMIPQLRGALQEVVDRGLAEEIHPREYAGCYVPRFIARDPRKGLSLHTWGIAVDLNVPGNQRGTSGEISREVVTIFKKWGFAWGGDWSYTDPMHFELARLVTAR